MNSFLLNRQLGSISPQAFATAQNHRLLRSLQSAPDVQFRLQEAGLAERSGVARGKGGGKAHAAGVNSIAIDRFEGRYLLSAGADSSLAIWDLENPPSHSSANPSHDGLHTPLAHAKRTSTSESTLGITHTSYYPFDSLAFLTSGYDKSLKLFDSETLTASATFDLSSVVYSHSTSTVPSSHLLVACATQHPAVRLIDLRSGSSAHALAGHSRAVLAVSWHSKNENILVSGSVDGCIRLWDVRRSASSLGVLDAEDSIGLPGYDGHGTGVRGRERGRAHNGAVNGLTWTEDGAYLVSVGHDERMRVWDMVSGANTLVNFGPGLKNTHTAALFPLIAPSYLSPTGQETVFYPNPKEITSFSLHTGTLLNRLRIPPNSSLPHTTEGSSRNLTPRTTSLAWRAHSVEMFSGHADGGIRCWRPRLWEDFVVEREEREEREGVGGEGDIEGQRKRKREELEGIVRDLTGGKRGRGG